MTDDPEAKETVRVSEWNSDGFAERLNEAFSGRSAYSIEKQTGIAQSLVRKYLSGQATPGADKLVLLAQASGCSVDWLATGRESGGRPTADIDRYGRAERFELPASAVEEAQRRLDDIATMLEEAESLPLEVENSPKGGPNMRALRDIRQIAHDDILPRDIRMRAAQYGEMGFQDPRLAELREQLERENFRTLGNRFREIAADLDSAIKEVGYEPGRLVREGLKTAMYSHGLTRDGAVTLLQFLQADQEQRNGR